MAWLDVFPVEARHFRQFESQGRAVLEGLNKFDIGGLKMSYRPDDHTGLDFADLSIISDNGKFRR